jgi:hypothetical protein
MRIEFSLSTVSANGVVRRFWNKRQAPDFIRAHVGKDNVFHAGDIL